MKSNPLLNAVVALAVKEGKSIKEVLERGAQDLTYRIAKTLLDK